MNCISKNDFDFHQNGNIVQSRYCDINACTTDGIITNIARVTKESSDCQISCLIKQLNDSYTNIKYMKENIV